MSAADDFIKGLPIDQLAAQLGADPGHVQAAARQVVPALLGGMAANAEDPGRAASLADAVGQHSGELADSGDLDRVDPAEGEKIAQHVFGDQQGQVVATLGGINAAAGGGGNDLVAKLIPLLAPLVLSFVAKQVAGQGGAGGGGGALGQILGQVLSGAAQGSGGSAKAGGGLPGGLGDLLGGLLGGGRKK